MAFERLLRLTKKCPGYVVSGLRNASFGIATVTQESFKSQYYVTQALFCARSLFSMTSQKTAPSKKKNVCAPFYISNQYFDIKKINLTYGKNDTKIHTQRTHSH